MRAFTALLVALTAFGGVAHAQERVVRGFHQGRAYRLFVPATPVRSRPLVVALHGCGQTPDEFALATRLDRAAGPRGVHVLYPAQSQLRNPSRCWNWFVGDVETHELLSLIRAVQRTHGDGNGRIVVIGFSAGGYMAVNITCVAPELVAGVGVAAGGPYRCAEGSGGPVACMRGERLDGEAAAKRCVAATRKPPKARASLWHGAADTVVSPSNQAALMTMFTALRGGQEAIARHLVPGMQHAWSGGDPRGSHTYPEGPDATEAMLRFLVDD